MTKKIMGISFFLLLGFACYVVKDSVEQSIRNKLREVAKQELVKPIKAKVKKILSRSKVRLAMRRQRIKLNYSRL